MPLKTTCSFLSPVRFGHSRHYGERLGYIRWLGAVFLLFRRLLREGMWCDGVMYAAISRNMAIGKGTFWTPYFSSSFWIPFNPSRTFYEHPPLMFYLQSWFFRVLGNSYLTERVYCFVVVGLTISLLVKLWRQLVPVTHPLHQWEWLPVFLFFTFRMTEWAYAQNFLDCTMSAFCLLVVYLIIEGWQQPQYAWRFGVLAVLATMGAFLTKGPVGLHVLAVPVVYGLFCHRPLSSARIFRWTLLITTGFLILVGMMLMYEPARVFLHTYFNQQIWASLLNKREHYGTVESTGRTYILTVMLKNMAPALAIIVLIEATNRLVFRNNPTVKSLSRVRRFYGAMALAATLPIMGSAKQIEYYIVPALPYLALGLGAWMGPELHRLLASLPTWPQGRIVSRMGGWMLLAALSLYSFQIAGTPYHNQSELLEDTHNIGQILPRGTQLGVCPDVKPDIFLCAYLQRYYQIELTPLQQTTEYALSNAQCRPKMAAAGFQPSPLLLKRYFIYQRPTAQLEVSSRR